MINKRKISISILLGILYASFIIVGNSFMLSNSFQYIEKNIFINVLFYLFLIIIISSLMNYLFTRLDNKKKFNIPFKNLSNTKVYKLFHKHPFLFCLTFIILCWLPYIISFYPAILSKDPSFQIKQFFQIPNKYSDYVVMLDPNVTITNHHPVIHTLLLGNCVKVGLAIHNVNLGLFLYSLIQIFILSSTLAYTIKFLKDLKVKNYYLIIMLLIYSFVPIFPFYAMSAVKDVIFGSLIILYITVLYKLIKKDTLSNSDVLKIIILLALIILFRNNGIHTIILSFPLLFLLHKKWDMKKKIIGIFLIIIGLNYTYSSILLPHFKITPTSPREMLSIPFQQTARYVKEHEGDVTKEEQEVIDKILDYDTLANRYEYDIADPVKNEYNKYTTKEDLVNYFEVWFQEFTKHPKTYLEATISNTYGYVYPLKTRWFIYYKYVDIIVEDGFDYHYNNLKESRATLTKFGESFPYIPVLGLLVNIGFNVWLLMFMFAYLFYKRKYKELIFLAPSFVLILICFASPVNSYFRYALPYVFALMLDMGLFLKECDVFEKTD